MRVVLATTNPTVGDVDANAAKIIEAIDAAREDGAGLVVLPELAVSGYPPRDLLHVEGFIDGCAAAAKRIGEEHTGGITCVFGMPLPSGRGGIANSALVYRDGTLIGYYDKRLLPTYDVFDEDRYFVPGNRPLVFEAGETRIGVAICEDLWKGEDVGFAWRYANAEDPVRALVDAGAQVVVCPTASPFVIGKGERHRNLLERHAAEHGIHVLSVNQLGGNDDLVFDGHAYAYAPGGGLAGAKPLFEESRLVVDLGAPPSAVDPSRETAEERLVIDALTTGVRDYMGKTGHRDAVIALSGGIDSALTAAVAVRALGGRRVRGAAMPSRFSSAGSETDAQELARRLGIEIVTMPIAAPVEVMGDVLNAAFDRLDHRRVGAQLPDVTQENLQSRIRGTLMMGWSNRSGALLLTTGNKSELAVGYCTLYGDMNGGLAVLSDVPKTLVYRLSRYANACWRELGFEGPPIPESSIEKPPSAELAPDQLDADSLPPYEELDQIVERHVEDQQGAERIASETGIDLDVVRRMCRLIDLNEYKRRQLAIGIKVTSIAFGPGRRFPLAQRWVR